MTALWVAVLACLAAQATSQGCDPDKEFACMNGFCIDIARRCNGVFECLDFSDEDGCPVAKCEPGKFQCGSGDCIPGQLRCNGSPDCPDQSDESGCVKILCHGHSFIYNAVTKTCMTCQHNTQGRNCDQCKPGYYGNAKVGTMTDCKPCSCNGHATECDVVGNCKNCGHNTEGEKCEQCRPGFRGDATKGTPTDCKPSGSGGGGSPGAASLKTCNTCNGHSTQCNANGICVNCQDNTEGDKCEKCKKGWWGDPAGSKNCLRCTCHNHADDCEKPNGKCINCKDNTKGFFCDECKPGFTGKPKEGKADSCKPSNCDALCNKHSTKCDVAAGKCMNCMHNTEGDKCEKCKTGYTGDATKGTPTDCKQGNSACFILCNKHSYTCDLKFQRCKNCQDNTEGPQCEVCKPGFTGDATKGPCKSCSENCNKHSSTCDKKTGICSACKDNTEGNMCEKCKAGFTGDATKGTPNDCKPTGCRCNKHSNTCPGGKCQNCQHHTTGVYCEHCEPGYYGKATGQTPNDCKKCPCSPRSTMCLEVPGQAKPKCMGCVDGYLGEKCDKCDTVNGFVPLSGGPAAPTGCCVRKGVSSCPAVP